MVAGPLGAAIGGWLGGALGPGAAELMKKLAEKYAEKTGEFGGEKLFDTGVDSLSEYLRKRPVSLENLYREVLRTSLADVHRDAGSDFYKDWFLHWDAILRRNQSLELPPVVAGGLVSDELPQLFRQTVENLDAQGVALMEGNISINQLRRDVPNDLIAKLEDKLPELLQERYRELITSPEYEAAYKQADLVFREYVASKLSSIDTRTGEILKIVTRLEEAQQRDRFREREQKDLEEKVRLLRIIADLEERIRVRASEPAENDIWALIKDGKVDEAAGVKARQVEASRTAARRLPDDLYEEGLIHELRFDATSALGSFREAWELEPEFSYGFKYASCLSRLNHYEKASHIYESLLGMEPNEDARAHLFNSLANCYSRTQRLVEAGEYYSKALEIRRALAKTNLDVHLLSLAVTLLNFAGLRAETLRFKESEELFREAWNISHGLAEANPGAYGSYESSILNNLGLLLRRTQRLEEAEKLFSDALKIDRQSQAANRPGSSGSLARTLNNIAAVYAETQRFSEAITTYREALDLYRSLAANNPDSYRGNVAGVLQNLGALYGAIRSWTAAETTFREAIEIYRSLARDDPKTYLRDVAECLNDFANFLTDTHQSTEARALLTEAIGIMKELATANPDAYLPGLATMRNNLGTLFMMTGQFGEAEQELLESLKIRRELATKNHTVFSPFVASTLSNLASVYDEIQRPEDAQRSYIEALEIYRAQAGANPTTYMPRVATVWNNLAVSFHKAGRMQEARDANHEANQIIEPLWLANQAVYAGQMNQIRQTQALIEGVQRSTFMQLLLQELAPYRDVEDTNDEE